MRRRRLVYRGGVELEPGFDDHAEEEQVAERGRSAERRHERLGYGERHRG